MAFYFSRKRPAQGRGALNVGGIGTNAPHNASPVTAQNKGLLRRLGCKACPLDKADVHTPKMPPTLSKGAAVYIIGESPGASEDEKSGRPFTGPSGKLIRECIPDGERCSFDNVINCRPSKDNRTPTQQEIQCCFPRKEKHVEEAKPKLILGLGVVPLQAIMGTSDMAGMRGRVFAVKIGSHACWFLPTYHPSFILRLARDGQRPLNSMFGNCFKQDVKKAFELAHSLEQPIIDTEADVRANIQCFDGTKESDFHQLCFLLKKAKAAPLKCIDLETKGLHPWATDGAIMTAAISFGGTNFAFALHHPKSGWGRDLRPILDLLKSIIEDDTIKVSHNAPYEIRWFIHEFGLESINHAAWQCSQMQAHFLDERKGQRNSDDSKASRYQALDFLVKQYFGISFKPLFKLDKKDMSKSDLGETLLYNGCDTKYCLKLFLLQDQLLEERGLLDAYLDSVPRQPTVALMQHLGVPVDQKACKAAQVKLAGEIKSLEVAIFKTEVVKKFIADRKAFNPFSQPDVLTLFKDYLKRPEVKIQDKSGKDRLSVDKNILDKIDHPLADLIVRIRNRNKMKSTYVDDLELGKGSLIFPDGKLHPSFNTTFTETSRLSSDSPNAQNWPKREDSWLRAQVVPPPRHLFVAVDYGQLEACTGAMCSKDKYLVKALWEDYDVHAEWAKRTALACPELIGGKINLTDKGVMKKFRSIIKNKLTFPAFFGASNQSVRGYLHNATGYPVEQEIIDGLMRDFWRCFTGMAEWQKQTMKQYYDLGYVQTLCGRRHHYPLTKNQAVNMPIQGSGAELVCDAMNRLSHLATSTGQWHLHPHLNVHDDLSFFIPDDDKILDESLRIISREMLTFDYDWINVPLSIEISIGRNWADIYPLEDKVWSHREFAFPRRSHK